MDTAIKTILQSHRANSVYHTHVSLFNPKGKFQFNRNDLEKFWNEYCDLIYSNLQIKLGVAEKPQPYLPVLVDVDLKLRSNDLVSLYSLEDVKQLIHIYQAVLREILEDVSELDLTCFLLEKKPYFKEYQGEKYVKNGYHLHFPYIFVHQSVHKIHLLPRIQEQVREKYGEERSKSIDDSYCRNAWLLYGASKGDDMEPYKLTKIFNHYLDEMPLEKALRSYKIYDNMEKQIKFEEDIQWYLPRILSIIPFNREAKELKQTIVVPPKYNTFYKKNEIKTDTNVTGDLEIAKKLLDFISPTRAENRDDWMNIGWAIYNVGKGSHDALILWIEFSKKCMQKFNESVCIFEWDKMIIKNVTLGTLHHYAKMDNPEGYKQFKETQTTDKLNKAVLLGSHTDIAQIMYDEYRTDYVCASISSKQWFQFNNHVWRSIEEGVYIRNHISRDMVEKYNKIKATYNSLMDANSKDLYESKINQINKMIGKLKSSPFKNNVMRECLDIFYNSEFIDKLDANQYLIAFENGIYDLKTNTFRDGKPEDYISIQMNIKYEELEDDDPRVLEVYDFLEKIFPDKSVRRYFMDVSSDIFVGGNQNKKLHVWSGEGDNGKSITQTLFETMLGKGKYCIKFPTTVLTGKRAQSSAACPELARAGKGQRLVFVQEPDQTDTMNIGILKELTGNDTFFARGLFKEGKEMVPMFKLILVCNKPPKLPYNDKATWNRIRVIPFESTFVPLEQCPETHEEQLKQKIFPVDPYFGDKIPDLAQAFAWVLLRHRKTISQCQRVEPDKVKLATDHYRTTNDFYKQFIEESLTEDQSASISLVELYTAFKEWFRESIPNQSIPIKTDVRDYFIKIWGNSNRNKWKNWRIKTIRDDIESGDIVVMENQGIELPDI